MNIFKHIKIFFVALFNLWIFVNEIFDKIIAYIPKPIKFFFIWLIFFICHLHF
jgi:hypothetical protein